MHAKAIIADRHPGCTKLRELTANYTSGTIFAAEQMYSAFVSPSQGSTEIMTLIFNILSLLLSVMQIVIIARMIFSWFDPTGRTVFGALIVRVTDPVIVPIRRVMPNTGVIDLSPMVTWLVIFLLQQLLQRTYV